MSAPGKPKPFTITIRPAPDVAEMLGLLPEGMARGILTSLASQLAVWVKADWGAVVEAAREGRIGLGEREKPALDLDPATLHRDAQPWAEDIAALPPPDPYARAEEIVAFTQQLSAHVRSERRMPMRDVRYLASGRLTDEELGIVIGQMVEVGLVKVKKEEQIGGDMVQYLELTPEARGRGGRRRK
jgi:hypothetical protein